MPVTKQALLDRVSRNREIIFIEIGPWTITANKAHALQYGTVTGVILALLATYISLPLTTLLLGMLLVLSFHPTVEDVARWLCHCNDYELNHKLSIAIITIEHKPHYYWFALLPAFSIVYTLLT